MLYIEWEYKDHTSALVSLDSAHQRLVNADPEAIRVSKEMKADLTSTEVAKAIRLHVAGAILLTIKREGEYFTIWSTKQGVGSVPVQYLEVSKTDEQLLMFRWINACTMAVGENREHLDSLTPFDPFATAQ